MKILSIETSSSICAVAILEDNKLIKEISQDNGLTHSEKLMPMINQILTETNIQLNDIDLLVCDKGPGSFTGIRIGVATVKAFTDSLDIPSIGISSLEALCYNVKENGIICSLIDAKNDNCYYGVFNNENQKYTLINELSVDNIHSILEILKDIKSPITFVGNGVSYKDIILNVLPDSKFIDNNNLSSFNLGLAGYNHFKNDNTKEDLLPLYLRIPKAQELMEAKQNG